MDDYAIIADNGGSDLRYRDIVGEVYTFPSMYRDILIPGTKFIYQRCGVSSMRVAEPDAERLLDAPHYFGSAEIGRVKELGMGMYEAEIINYRHFSHGVPFRLSDGSHFEVARGQFWRNGVRRSIKEVYEEIIKCSETDIPVSSPFADIEPPVQGNTRSTSNRRTVARNRSSVQVRESLQNTGIVSQSFANDCLEIVTDKTSYWLHDIAGAKYYLIAKIEGASYNRGTIKVCPKILSREPKILSDKSFGLFHLTSPSSRQSIGKINVKPDCIEFQGDRSVKTIDISLETD